MNRLFAVVLLMIGTIMMQEAHSQTVTLNPASKPGGVQDIHARIAAKYLGNYLVTNPKIVVSNLENDALAAHEVSVSPPGDRIGITGGGPFSLMILQNDYFGMKFEDFYFIGSGALDERICYEMTERKGDKIGYAGANLVGSSVIYYKITEKYLSSRFNRPLKLISGYTSNGDRKIALESGELNTECTTPNPIVDQWLENGKATLTFKFNDPNLFRDINIQDIDRRAIELLLSTQKYKILYVISSKTPENRKTELRIAFDSMFKDKGFIGDMNKTNLDYSYASSKEVFDIFYRARSQPQEVVEKSNDILK